MDLDIKFKNSLYLTVQDLFKLDANLAEQYKAAYPFFNDFFAGQQALHLSDILLLNSISGRSRINIAAQVLNLEQYPELKNLWVELACQYAELSLNYFINPDTENRIKTAVQATRDYMNGKLDLNSLMRQDSLAHTTIAWYATHAAIIENNKVVNSVVTGLLSFSSPFREQQICLLADLLKKYKN